MECIQQEVTEGMGGTRKRGQNDGRRRNCRGRSTETKCNKMTSWCPVLYMLILKINKNKTTKIHNSSKNDFISNTLAVTGSRTQVSKRDHFIQTLSLCLTFWNPHLRQYHRKESKEGLWWNLRLNLLFHYQLDEDTKEVPNNSPSVLRAVGISEREYW